MCVLHDNMSYAATTHVSTERSQAEIQQTLRKYGASRFGVMEDENGAHVLFAFANLNIQMSVPLPNRTDDEFTKTPTGKPRSIDQQRDAYDQKVKAQWRALMLAIKSKLVSIKTGVSTVEKEFMAWVVMSDGKTLGDYVMPHLENLKAGKAPGGAFLALTK